MPRIDIDAAIQMHIRWRRQFLSAFADGAYAMMPLSEHRACTLTEALQPLHARFAGNPDYERLIRQHLRFHNLANDIIDLDGNGLADSADLLLPELSDACDKVVDGLDWLRTRLTNAD